MSRRVPTDSGAAITAAAVAVRVWGDLIARLAPIIMKDELRLLFERSLRLTAGTFPWLASAETPQADAPFAGLEVRLERQTPALAEEANRALLATFTGLLNKSIGEALTTRLLTPGPRQPAPQQRKWRSAR